MMRVVIFDFFGVVYDPATRLPSAGLVDFLEKLRERKLFCGIASSSERSHIAEFLAEHDLQKYFSVVIGLGEVQATKPDPECYFKVAEFFQVHPTGCVIIDDSEAPLFQAQSEGFQTIYFEKTATDSGLDNFVKIATLLGL